MLTRIFSFIVGVFSIIACSMANADTITVSAAASLTNAFKELGQTFEQKHSGDKIELNFAASGVLLQQIIQGAPVDVFASADQATMDKAVAAGVIKTDTRVNFVSNELVLITAKNSAIKAESLKDLTSPEITHIAIGNPATTPNGNYARNALQQANLWSNVENKLVLAENVRQSLNYVERQEADVGFVFSTDAQQDKDHVKVLLKLPTYESDKSGKWVKSSIVYPIAETTSKHSALAGQFIEFVRSTQGQSILAKYGFGSAD